MKVFKLSFLFLVFVIFIQCDTAESVLAKKYVKVNGKTMGTTYHITYYDPQNRKLKKDIVELLLEVNNDVSTYIDSSFISKFNNSESGIKLDATFASSDSPNRHFLMNYYKSKQIFKMSNGAFDPTVMPLINYWGFGIEKRPVLKVDSVRVDSIMQFVGYNLIKFHEGKGLIEKKKKGIALDFSAIAKGYGVDAVCELFDQLGIENYFVEIGGEVRAKGKNAKNRVWTVGINTPRQDAGAADFQVVVRLPSVAIATSGNYRNFYKVDGVKYAHTIDPFSGYPKSNSLLSASIFAEDCMTADAVATACMVLGLEDAIAMVEKEKGMEGYFIYGDEKGGMKTRKTSGMDKLILK